MGQAVSGSWAPSWARRERVMLGGIRIGMLGAEEKADSESWRVCRMGLAWMMAPKREAVYVGWAYWVGDVPGMGVYSV